MDEWELLNTEDGLALQDAMYAPIAYQLHELKNLPHNADKTVSARFTEESLRFKND